MIYDKLKELRKKRGLTQEQMAEALHKSQNAYSLIEQGKSKLDAELIPEVCDILKVTPEELFENNVNFNFNEKVENGYATYIQTLYSNNQEAVDKLNAQHEKQIEYWQQIVQQLKNVIDEQKTLIEKLIAKQQN